MATTTVKLNTCCFSETRIYPGHGSTFISKDGKSRIFQNSKCKRLYLHPVKPAKLCWTQAWRRANKKFKVIETGPKKRRERTVKTQKAIVGLSLDEIKAKSVATSSTTKPAAAKPAAAKPAAAKP